MTDKTDAKTRWRSPRGQLPRGPGRFAEPTTFLIVFISTILVAAAVAGPGWNLLASVPGMLGFILAALVYRSGIRIEGDSLVKDGLLGARNKPPHELAVAYGLTKTSWSRNEVAGATEGKVVWGRSLVTGVRIHLEDGTNFGLPYSYCLGDRRRHQWINAIQNWAGRED